MRIKGYRTCIWKDAVDECHSKQAYHRIPPHVSKKAHAANPFWQHMHQIPSSRSFLAAHIKRRCCDLRVLSRSHIYALISRTYMHSYLAHICTHISHIYALISRTYMHSYLAHICTHIGKVWLYTYICIYICIHMYVNMYMCMYIYIRIFTYIKCIHVQWRCCVLCRSLFCHHMLCVTVSCSLLQRCSCVCRIQSRLLCRHLLLETRSWSLQCAHFVAVCCSVLQYAAVCCSELQCAAVCCSQLQRTAVYCSVLQRAAVCCSVLQRDAVFCNVL